MYAKLTGRVSDVLDNYIILEVNSVGYRVEGLADVLEGVEISVYTYTYVREQEIRIFGFRSKQELILFEKLLNVQGVGPKIAVKLINSISLDVIVNAIVEEDDKSLRVPGLGEKLAKKIILDMKGKVTASSNNIIKNQTKNGKDDEIVQALVVLGYNEDRVIRFINEYNSEMESMGLQERIKYILKFIKNNV